jgi:enamine deaminase RidA (YjgF/YER057c/UK114 family)
MAKKIIHTDNAPKAIGSYSQAVRAGQTVYLTDFAHFTRVNEIMAKYFREPYPARAAVGAAALPRGALVEMDAVLVIEK